MTDPGLVGRLLEWIDTTAVMAAAQIGVADVLAGGPLTPAEAAAALSVDEGALARLLRVLTGTGVVASEAGGRFGLGPDGHLLRSDVPGSLRPLLRTMGGKIGRSIFEAQHTVRTGTPAFDHLYGSPPFTYLAGHPGEAAVFNASMAAFGEAFATPAVDAYDFTGVGELVDVGGGHGQLTFEILRRHPGLQAVIYDSPATAAEALPKIEAAGLAGRCRAVGGDFFTEVPPGDCYTLRWVIHDWDDDRAAAILACCRRAVRPAGRLLLFEVVMPEGDAPHPAKSLDYMMLATLTGRERTAPEHAALLARSGWRLQRVIASASPMSVVEAVPA